MGLLHVDPEKFEPRESSRLHFVTPMAIKLLLTEPRPLGPVLKCSITSQLDFLRVPVLTIGAQDEGGTWSSSDTWAVLVCRREAARRVNPVFLTVVSYRLRRDIKEGALRYLSNIIDNINFVMNFCQMNIKSLLSFRLDITILVLPLFSWCALSQRYILYASRTMHI